MKRYVSLFIVVLLFTLSPGAVSAGKKLCKASLEVSFDSGSKSGAQFRNKRKAIWGTKAKGMYGAAYGDWGLAKNKKSSCKNMWSKRVIIGAKPPKFRCVAKAKPCIVKAPKKTCYGRVVSNGYEWGRGPGRTKKKAKALARISWQQKVTGLYGGSFSDWKRAKKPNYTCDIYQGNYKTCTVSARPCN